MFKLPLGSSHKLSVSILPEENPLAIGTPVRVISYGANGERHLYQLGHVCEWPAELPPPTNYYFIELSDGRCVGMHRRDLSTDAIDLVAGLD